MIYKANGAWTTENKRYLVILTIKGIRRVRYADNVSTIGIPCENQ